MRDKFGDRAQWAMQGAGFGAAGRGGPTAGTCDKRCEETKGKRPRGTACAKFPSARSGRPDSRDARRTLQRGKGQAPAGYRLRKVSICPLWEAGVRSQGAAGKEDAQKPPTRGAAR